MNKRLKDALNFIFECLETRDLSKNQQFQYKDAADRLLPIGESVQRIGNLAQ